MSAGTYRVDLESVEQVEGNGREQIEQEPTADIVQSDLPRIIDDLTTLAHVRRSKVEYYICIGRKSRNIAVDIAVERLCDCNRLTAAVFSISYES